MKINHEVIAEQIAPVGVQFPDHASIKVLAGLCIDPQPSDILSAWQDEDQAAQLVLGRNWQDTVSGLLVPERKELRSAIEMARGCGLQRLVEVRSLEDKRIAGLAFERRARRGQPLIVVGGRATILKAFGDTSNPVEISDKTATDIEPNGYF